LTRKRRAGGGGCEEKRGTSRLVNSRRPRCASTKRACGGARGRALIRAAGGERKSEGAGRLRGIRQRRSGTARATAGPLCAPTGAHNRVGSRVFNPRVAGVASGFICICKVWFICMLRLGEGGGRRRRSVAVRLRFCRRQREGRDPAELAVCDGRICERTPEGSPWAN